MAIEMEDMEVTLQVIANSKKAPNACLSIATWSLVL